MVTVELCYVPGWRAWRAVLEEFVAGESEDQLLMYWELMDAAPANALLGVLRIAEISVETPCRVQRGEDRCVVEVNSHASDDSNTVMVGTLEGLIGLLRDGVPEDWLRSPAAVEVCPACKGTRVYVGLFAVEPCASCCSGG